LPLPRRPGYQPGSLGVASVVLEETAPAKVNLFLHVVGRRPDGYHLLDSLAVFPGVGDTLHAAPADSFRWRWRAFRGALQEAVSDNLVLRAARGLAELTGVRTGAYLTLAKTLPWPRALAVVRPMLLPRCGYWAGSGCGARG